MSENQKEPPLSVLAVQYILLRMTQTSIVWYLDYLINTFNYK